LTNLGKKQFTTPWYSHHFFTGDDDPVGPGYVVDFGISQYGLPTHKPQFTQPGLGSWSGDINDYANVTMAPDGSISMTMTKLIPDGIKLKADFLDDNTPTLADGSFTLHAPNGVLVHEKIPELQTQSRNPFIYAYNFYAERGTFSPEPMLLLYLQPGETTFWTQHLKFSIVDKTVAADKESPLRMSIWSMFTSKVWKNSFNISSSYTAFMTVVVVLAIGIVVASYIHSTGGSLLSPRRRRPRCEYSTIPDYPIEQEKPGIDDVVISVV